MCSASFPLFFIYPSVLLSQSAFPRGRQRVKRFLFILTFTDQRNLISAFDTSPKHTEYALGVGRGITELECYHRFILHRFLAKIPCLTKVQSCRICRDN